MSYLIQGDKMYLQALNDGFVACLNLSVFQVVYKDVSYKICDSVIDTSNIGPTTCSHAKTTTTPVNPFVTQNNDTINSLPMVVGQNNSILYSL